MVCAEWGRENTVQMHLSLDLHHPYMKHHFGLAYVSTPFHTYKALQPCIICAEILLAVTSVPI